MDEQELKDVQTPQMKKKTRRCTRLFNELMKTLVETVNNSGNASNLHKRLIVGKHSKFEIEGDAMYHALNILSCPC
jgi:hypothetical protein